MTQNLEPSEVFDGVVGKLREKTELSEDVYRLARNFWEKRQKYVSSVHWALASVYAAIRVSDCTPMSLKDLLVLSGFRAKGEWPTSAERWEARHIIGLYRRILKDYAGSGLKLCYMRPDMYVKSYAGQLGVGKRTLGYALRLCNQVAKRRLNSGNPRIVAAAILYIACQAKGEPIPQFKLSVAAQCTEMSLRSKFHKFRRILLRITDAMES